MQRFDSNDDGLFLAGAENRFGELYEARGDRARVAEHYASVVELWKNAEPDLQPVVVEVRHRLGRLDDPKRKKARPEETFMFVNDFTGEYARYRALGEKAIAQAPDDALNRVPDAESNSLATIVHHVSGNLLSRFTEFLTADGEKPWRNRDAEFEERPATRAELVERWNAGFKAVADQLATLGDDQLTRAVSIRGATLTVHEALCRSLAHTAMHTGQVVYLAKMFAGADWKTLSIPKGKSATYNADPKGEHAAAHTKALDERR